MTTGEVKSRSAKGKQSPVERKLKLSGDFGSDMEDLMSHEYRPVKEEIPRIGLLVVLYMLQGIPLGLVFGTIPFILKSSLSYSDLAVFSVAGYPYSLKLLWSPIVDSVYSPTVGRRKTWIIPIQTLLGLIFIFLSFHAQDMFYNHPDIYYITFIWTLIVFCAATQDIAVDGWALTLLAKNNISYASTSQTIGLNCGFFMSFTVFLALNSEEFCKNWLGTSGEAGLVAIDGYLFFWGFMYLLCTGILLLFVKEDKDDDDMSAKEVYIQIWKIINLPSMKSLLVLLLVHKIGFICNDAVTGLKLLEKGFKKEDLALTVLIDFPFQIILGVYVASWSKGPRPLKPFFTAMMARQLMAAVALFVVVVYPADNVISSGYFGLVVISTVLSSCVSTSMFVSQGAFFARIGDPAIGGTYLTLLNTFSNFGGTWPKFFVLRFVDFFTDASCVEASKYDDIVSAHEAGKDLQDGFVVNPELDCITDDVKALCKEQGGKCYTFADGYYIVAISSIFFGFFIIQGYVKRACNYLERVKEKDWRVQ
eukprot:Nk52_evm115s221 gene=Nk52_evmTU115s221